MGEVVQFVPRNAQTRKPMTVSEGPIDLKAIEAEIVASTWGVSPSVYYESSLGFVDYVAPESDPA